MRVKGDACQLIIGHFTGATGSSGSVALMNCGIAWGGGSAMLQKLTGAPMRGWTVAGWSLIFAVAVAAIAGYQHSDWWVPVAVGVCAAIARDAIERLRLTRAEHGGFLIGSAIAMMIFAEVFWGAGYGLSRML